MAKSWTSAADLMFNTTKARIDNECIAPILSSKALCEPKATHSINVCNYFYNGKATSGVL